MDQKKIGKYLKELRISKNLTQEELADKFYVSNRTISRWETGTNLPDIALLIELADFYKCDIREIIEGGSINNMNNEEKDVAIKVAKYETSKNEKSYKKIFGASVISLVAFALFGVLKLVFPNPNNFGMDALTGFFLGISIGAVIYIALYSTDVLQKIHKIKWLRVLIIVLCILALIVFLATLAAGAWFTKA